MMKNETKIRRVLVYSLSLLVIPAGLGLAPVAVAQTTTTKPSVTGMNPTGPSTAIQSLREAHKLLTEADHDYEGHRAKAAEEVHKAIKELESKHHHKGAGAESIGEGTAHSGTAQKGLGHAGATGAKKSEKTREPQATSDSQLKQALSLLQAAQSELASQNQKAAANVTAAVSEIKTALSIK